MNFWSFEGGFLYRDTNDFPALLVVANDRVIEYFLDRLFAGRQCVFNLADLFPFFYPELENDFLCRTEKLKYC